MNNIKNIISCFFLFSFMISIVGYSITQQENKTVKNNVFISGSNYYDSLTGELLMRIQPSDALSRGCSTDFEYLQNKHFPVAASGEAGNHGQGESLDLPVWQNLNGPYGGYTSGFAVDPQNSNIIYVSTQGGGIYKSTNKGASWFPARTGITCDWMKQVCVTPGNSNIVFCAGSNYWMGNEGDVYKSTNGGQSWASCGLEGTWWYGVHVLAGNPNVVIAGGELGIYRSTNQGGSWTFTGKTGSVLEIVCDPSHPDTLYTGTYGYRIYRSTDAGVTWSTIGAAIPNGNIRTVAVDPDDGKIIYAAAYDMVGTTGGIYRSMDFGATWAKVLSENTWSVRVSPRDSEFVVAAGDGPSFTATPGVWVSHTKGSSWTKAPTPTSHYSASFAHNIAVDPSDFRVAYVGFYRAGVCKSTDQGTTWLESNNGLSSDFVNSIVVDNNNPKIIYAGTFQADMWKTTNAGATWFWSAQGFSELNHAVNCIAINPTNSNILYAGGSNSGVFKSTDAGANWTLTSLANYSEVRDIAISNSNPNIVWAGVTNSSATLGAWRSTDSGNLWSRKYSEATMSAAVNPKNGNIVLIGTSTWMYNPAQILRSTDGGETFSTVYDGEGYGAITDIDFSATDPNIIFASGLYSDIIKSYDGGVTWTSHYGGFAPAGRIFDVMADLKTPNLVYVPVDDNCGFYASQDGGDTWILISDGLWNKSLATTDVFYMGKKRVFYLGSMGAGSSGTIYP